MVKVCVSALCVWTRGGVYGSEGYLVRMSGPNDLNIHVH